MAALCDGGPEPSTLRDLPLIHWLFTIVNNDTDKLTRSTDCHINELPIKCQSIVNANETTEYNGSQTHSMHQNDYFKSVAHKTNTPHLHKNTLNTVLYQ